MVGAATEKPLEPKQVRTRGTHSKLVLSLSHLHEVASLLQDRRTLRTHAKKSTLRTQHFCSTGVPPEPPVNPDILMYRVGNSGWTAGQLAGTAN